MAYANEHRPWQLFQSVCEQLYHRCQSLVNSPRRFRFRYRLLTLDATMIDLCASLFDWAAYKRTKGAVKLYLLLDHQGYLPQFMVITPGKVQEIEVARRLRFQPGTILIMDRAYVDYAWFERLTGQGVFFVTRLRCDARYHVQEERPCRSGARFCPTRSFSWAATGIVSLRCCGALWSRLPRGIRPCSC